MGEQKDLQEDEDHCHVQGEASGPISDDVPCPLPRLTLEEERNLISGPARRPKTSWMT